jgi:hypothetical protein
MAKPGSGGKWKNYTSIVMAKPGHGSGESGRNNKMEKCILSVA